MLTPGKCIRVPVQSVTITMDLRCGWDKIPTAFTRLASGHFLTCNGMTNITNDIYSIVIKQGFFFVYLDFYLIMFRLKFCTLL